MNVSELLSRILEVSHDEVAPDTNLNNKALRWLNSAYHELMEVCLPFMEAHLKKTVTLTASAGVVALPSDVNRIISVVVDGNNIEGYSISYGNNLSLNINRIFDGDVVVSYLPRVNDLTEATVESAILVPQQFHSMLVWGGLVWASVYERGFNNSADLKLFQMKWDEAKRELKLSLSSSMKLNARYTDVV